MKHKLHKMMAMLVASIFAVGAFAQEVKTDYTDAIKNAAVTSKDDWTIESDGEVKYGDNHFKTSVKNLNINQTITLPAGKYKMTVKAAYRYGADPTPEEDEYAAIMRGDETHLAKVYAQTATYKYEGDVQNRWEGRSETDLFGNLDKVTAIVHEDVTYYVPNSSAAVYAWFEKGKYVNELVFNVQEEGEVTIGIAKSSTVGDYTNISAWTLIRLGDAEADPEVEEEELPEAPADGTDMTSYIKNAQVASTEGWTNANTRSDEKYDGAPDDFYFDWCHWNDEGTTHSFDMYQELSGLPAGVYELKAATRSDSRMVGTIYANKYSTEFHHVGNQGNELGRGWGWTVVSDIFVTDGKLKIGFTGTASNRGVWAGADNFTLTFVSSDFLAATKNKFLALKDEFDYFSTGIYEVMYVGCVGDAYYALMDAVWALAEKEDATVEEYEACMVEMQKVMDDIVAIDAYYSSTFAPLADECFKVQDNSVATSEEAAAAFEEACAKMGWQGTMNVATVENLEAIVAAVEPVLHNYVQNALPINGYAFDYSFFLANPSFETGNLDGWTVASYSSQTNAYLNEGDKTTAGGDGDYLFNTWWQGVMLSQEAEGFPNGNYRLTASLASGDGGKAATIFLVANGEKKGFTMDHKGEFEDCSIEFKVTDGKVSIATIGGNDDASYNENGHWWYKSDNYRIHYLGDGGVTGVSLWTEETYIDEWSGEEMEYDLEWDTPRFTEVGATFKFEVEVEAPEDADKTITWSVSNDKVLSIDQTGLLTVIGSGSGIYEVIATAPNGICATCEVYVEAFLAGDITEMEVTCGGESWIEASKKGATYQLQVTYNEDATNVDLAWSSDDETVATVDQNGLVTIVGNGNTEVRVTAASGVEASITIWVEIVDDDVDGIKAVESEAKAVIYDLQGRRVQKMEKGLYIVNGRKVLVK